MPVAVRATGMVVMRYTVVHCGLATAVVAAKGVPNVMEGVDGLETVKL